MTRFRLSMLLAQYRVKSEEEARALVRMSSQERASVRRVLRETRLAA